MTIKPLPKQVGPASPSQVRVAKALQAFWVETYGTNRKWDVWLALAQIAMDAEKELAE